MKKICIIGLGYIGLPTASLLATKGFSVHGVDVNENIVRAISNGECIIEEPSLDILVKSAVKSGHLEASAHPVPADIFIIAVPTPFKGGHKPDLDFVRQAVDAIAPQLQPGNLVILESTVPVGTTESIASRIAKLRPDLILNKKQGQPGVFVAHCPERVLPGHILHELVQNDRIVGGINEESTREGVEFYKSFVQGQVQGTDSRTAEMVKLTENSFRDVNIAFANELSMLCRKFGIDVWDVIDLANRHPRVNILKPGPGVGGHCIAVDPWFLVDSAPETARLIHTARDVNNAKPQSVIEEVAKAAGNLKKPVVACLGIAFKPDVDDLRESPALAITGELAKSGKYEVLVCEPHIAHLPASIADCAKQENLPEAVKRADIVLALVAHKAFQNLDSKLLEGRKVIDTCGLFRRKVI